MVWLSSARKIEFHFPRLLVKLQGRLASLALVRQSFEKDNLGFKNQSETKQSGCLVIDTPTAARTCDHFHLNNIKNLLFTIYTPFVPSDKREGNLQYIASTSDQL